jgi:hypothetical protein
VRTTSDTSVRTPVSTPKPTAVSSAAPTMSTGAGVGRAKTLEPALTEPAYRPA